MVCLGFRVKGYSQGNKGGGREGAGEGGEVKGVLGDRRGGGGGYEVDG